MKPLINGIIYVHVRYNLRSLCRAFRCYLLLVAEDTVYSNIYLQLEISGGQLLTNMRNLTIFGTNYSFKRLREKVDKNDWKNHGAAAVVNAFYSPLENSIRE